MSAPLTISSVSASVISIPDVEAHIHAELSISPKPTSYHVGIPQPTKSRSGMTIPYRHATPSKRHVQIFDSQPLSSPSSRSGSISVSASVRSLHKHFTGTTPITDVPIHQLLKNSARTEPAATPHDPPIPFSSPSTSSTASSMLSAPAAPNSTVSTPPTSVGSADIHILTKMASITLMNSLPDPKLVLHPDMASVKPYEEQASVSPLIQSHAYSENHHITSGPSLLTQTAPREIAPSHDRDASSGVSVLGSPSTPISIKIADLGNASPSKQHFTEDIQTRQYRAPEAILGRRDWGTRADVWSVACVIFELLTAEYLFDPHGQGELFTKDDDHMAQIIELMGDFPLDAKMGGRYSREIFDHSGKSSEE